MADTRAVRLTLDEAVLERWIGRTRTMQDRIDRRQANFLKATIDPERTDLRDGDVLPAGWHWIYFLEAPRMDQLGRDGHASLGDFLPPVALPRRMWAGTRLEFRAPIRLGEEIRRVSRVASIERKTGRTGELCFVTVNHKFYSGSLLKLEEDHDIVYRSAQSTASSSRPPTAATTFDRSVQVTPSTTLLFRYSALTFNGHRIHYDIDFCRDVEGYPGLLCHAPLLATLMLNLAEQHGRDADYRIRSFAQKSLSPLFHDEPFTICLCEHDNGCDIWAVNGKGLLAATASLSFG